LKKVAAQVSAATDQWARSRKRPEVTRKKTVAAAGEIAERMTTEIRDFNDFQLKLNDTEKGALRLEVEKVASQLKANGCRWWPASLITFFALHTAASRAGQPELAEQIGSFRMPAATPPDASGSRCSMLCRRKNLMRKKHRAHGVENPPADAIVAETLAPRPDVQSRLIRPALVRCAT